MLVGGNTSPGIIGLPKRSRWNPDKAIQIAALAARGNIHPCPVIHEGKIIGIIRSENFYSPQVRFQPISYKLTYTNYNDLVSEFVSKGKQYQSLAIKTPTGAGVANQWYDLWTCAGYPPSTTLGGTAFTANKYDDTTAAAIVHGGNVSTDTKHILSTMLDSSGTTGCGLLIDRVLDYQSNTYNAASNQAMTNTNTAQRYISTGQPGLQMTWGADTAHNSTASNITQLQYTDNAGNTTQSMPTTPTVSIIVSAAASATTLGYRINAPATTATTITWGAFMPLASGDTGARLVDNFTTSAANSGTFVLALVYPIAYIPFSTGESNSIDQVFHISSLERVYDGACLDLMFWKNAAAGTSHLQFGATFGWG